MNVLSKNYIPKKIQKFDYNGDIFSSKKILQFDSDVGRLELSDCYYLQTREEISFNSEREIIDARN